MFERYISIDWSGAGVDEQRGDVGVLEATPPGIPLVVFPQEDRRGIRRWSRKEVIQYLRGALKPGDRRTLVALDFGFGLPWGSDRGVFGCQGWRAMLQTLGDVYKTHGTARATAAAINADPRFSGHGPYRFDESRTDYRFYLDRGVAYYRLVENAVSQAISQWYLGSGGAVGFHTISGLAALNALLASRDAGELSFVVWPQEGIDPLPGAHLVVESYPSLCPRPDSYGPCTDDHQRDAYRVLDWLLGKAAANELERVFSIQEKPFGRIDGTDFYEQVGFEGWIIGVG